MQIASGKLHRIWERLRVMCMAVLCVLVLTGIPFTARAIDQIDTTRKASLTVELFAEDKPAQGTAVRLYRVADMTDFGTFTLVGDFAQDQVVVNDLDSEGWGALARTLKDNVVSGNRQPYAGSDGSGVRYIGVDGTATYYGLPVGLYLVLCDKYVSSEKTYVPQPTFVTLPGHTDVNNPDRWVYDVVISPKPDVYEPEKINLRIRKIWKNDDASSRPAEIVVLLYADGQLYKIIRLNKANNWQYTTPLVDASTDWTIREIKVSGYKVKVEYGRTSITIVNTKEGTPSTPSTNTTLPQTGQLWWPVPLLAAAGMALFAVGWLRRRRYEEE